jgi:hypothetical protein
MNGTTDIKECATRTGRFGHFTIDGVATLCGRNDVATGSVRIVTGTWPSGNPINPVADCRNCNHKAFGVRRTR